MRITFGRLKVLLTALACVGAYALGATPAAASTIDFTVIVNTQALVGNPAGPYSLNFQLNDGSGGVGGGVNNFATVSNFNFFGGNAVGAATVSGGATGSLQTSVGLNDLSATFNDFYQEFNPGSWLSFVVSLTRNVDGPAPDAFVFAILDGGLFNIPTTNFGNALLVVDLTSAGQVQTFRGTGDYSSVTVQAVPEPATLVLFGIGLVGIGAIRRRF